MRNRFFIVFAALLAVGCAHVVPKELRAKVEPGLRPEALFKEPEAHKGKTAMLGGVIISASNTEKGTLIEAIEKPLDSQGRPYETDISRGRFIVVSEDYLDTAIYSRGRFITVVGEVLGRESRPLGEIQYPYLIIKSEAIYLHKPIPEPPVRFGIGIFHSF